MTDTKQPGRLLTIVIPTLNRSAFVLRTLSYYAARRFAGTVIVGDSSDPDHASLILKAIAGWRGVLGVEYLPCQGMNERASLASLAARVSTPYAVFIGDDDIAFTSGLDRSVSFLEANRDYIAAHGEGWCFEVRPDGCHGRMRVFEKYAQPVVEGPTPKARLQEYLSNYRVILFSVHRTGVWQRMWRDAPTVPDKAFGAELLPCCISAVSGKTRSLEGLYLLRQSHNARYLLPTGARWTDSPDWAGAFDRTSELIAEASGECGAAGESVSAAEVRSIFLGTYLVPCLQATQCPGPAPAAPLPSPAGPRGNSPLHRVVRAVPGARLAWRLAFRGYWELRTLVDFEDIANKVGRARNARMQRREIARQWSGAALSAKDEVRAFRSVVESKGLAAGR